MEGAEEEGEFGGPIGDDGFGTPSAEADGEVEGGGGGGGRGADGGEVARSAGEGGDVGGGEEGEDVELDVVGEVGE